MKKFCTWLLTAILGISFLTGCGGTKDSDDILVIEIFDGGYGVDFVNKTAEEFEKTHQNIKVDVRPTSYDETFETTLLSGRTTTDIFFSRFPPFKYMHNPVTIGKQRYECILEDLTEVYTNTVPGEDVLLIDKIDASLAEFSAFEKDGQKKYYMLPWIKGMVGFIKNNKVWKDSWEVPNTTDELIALCKQIKKDGSVPFIFSLDDSYYQLISPLFTAQYEGVAEMDRFWSGYDKNGNRYTPELMLYDGELETLKVMDELLKNENGYQHRYSNSSDFTSVQNYFLDGTEKIAMMVNGDWIEGEMRENYEEGEVDIEFIKTPVISALGVKLGIEDSVLSGIIDYADGNGELPNFTSSKGLTNKEVVDAVTEARNLTITNSGNHNAYVPVYSNLKNEAKDFLRLLASDKGIEYFVQSMGGYIPPYKYDYLGSEKTAPYISDFLKDTIRLIDESVYYIPQNKDKIFSVGQLYEFCNGTDAYEKIFAATNKADYMDAETLFSKNYKYVKDNWTTYLTRAGLK